MLFQHTTSWKHTIGFCVLFDVRDLGLNTSQQGFLHIAEHLMFVATKKFNQSALRIKRDLLFDVLDAYTSHDYLVLTAVCSRSDLDEACQVLSQMLSAWSCDRQQFFEEKEYIIQEIKDALSDPVNKAIKSLGNKDTVTRVIGDVQTIRQIPFSQVVDIKRTWKKMVNTAPRHLLIAGPVLTKKELDVFDTVFNKKQFTKPYSVQPVQPLVSKYISKPRAKALVVETTHSSPFLILLQRILYVRHLALHPEWEFSFVRNADLLFYTVHGQNNTVLDDKAAKAFLLAKPTKKEFILAQNIVTKHMDALSDGTDPQEILGWLDTIHIRNIPALQGKSFAQIRNVYAAMAYQDFLVEWKRLIGQTQAALASDGKKR